MEVEQLPDGRALAALSLAELREACGSRGLSKGGSRKDLHDRLKIRLELEKLREESSRKAKAKEDVVPNIGLQDTAVGQSDVVRQYLEAQQRRLERFAQFGQTTGVPHQQLSQPAEQHPHQHQQSQQQLRLLHQQTPPTAATTTTAAAAATTIPTPGYIAHVPIAPSPVPPSLGLNHSSAHLGRSSSSGGHGLSQAERVSSGGSSRAIAPAEVARTKATGMSTRKGKNASLAASVGSDFVLPSACTAVEPPALFVADDESSPSSSPLLLSQTAVTAAAGPAKPELPSPTTGSRTTSKATRSRLANKTTKPEVLLQPSPAKKTRLNSALEAAAVAAAAAAAAVSATEITSDEALRPSSSDGVVAIADDQLVPTLAPLTAAKRRRGALRQSSPALAGGSKGEALPMAVKSSPRAVRGAQAQPEPHGLASPKANIAATKEKPASVEVRRSRGRPRKTFGGDVSTMAVAGAPSTEAVLTDEPEIAAKSIGDSPTGTETGVGGSSVRERGKERERILDNAKPSKLDKIANTTDNWAAVAPETMANAEAATTATTTLTSTTTTIASSASLSSASKSPKVSEEKHPSSVADLLRSGKESVVVAVKSKDASVTKRSERSANRNEAQAEQLKESRESRSTRGKRLRSHDDVAVAQTTVSPGNETSRKLNKANRHKERTSKIDASAPSKDAKDQTLEDGSTMERDSSPHVEDPIEAALLALHGGCEDPPVSAPTSAARQPSPRAAPESPTQIHQAPLRSSVKGRGTSLREDKHGTLSVADRPVVATKSSAVVVSEMSPHRTCATAPSKLAENKANPSTVPEETPTPAEDIVTSEGAKELSFVKPESELLLKPTASSSSNLDRSEIRRSERNPRETRKRSKVENIVQRLARRGNGRYSNASTSPSSESNNSSSSSNVHVQAAALREPIVLLERTELSSLPTASEDVADVRPLASSDQVIPPTKTPTSDHELASRMSPEEDWSSGSNPMPASRTLNASDEKGSLPIDSERTMPTSPRSKRARRENGAVSDQGGDSAEGDASNGPVPSAARSGSEGETGQVKFGTALGSTTSLSPDECVMRLLGVLSSPPVEPRLPPASTVCSTPMSANAFKDDSRQQELKERPPPPEQQHQKHWQEQQSKCPRQRTSSSSSERSESKRSKRKASTEHLGSPADYSDPVSALLSTEGKHQTSSSKCSSNREALTEVLPTVAPSDAAKSSGRRDSIEAAVAALIGEPYEEDVPAALPVESVSSRKPDVGHIDREPVAESQSLVPRSRTGSSSEKKYSTPSAALSSASSSSLLSSVKSDRSSRHKDDRRKHERERKASASSGGRGVKSSSGSRSSRSRSSRSSKIDESSSRSTPPASAAQVMEGQAKREEVIGDGGGGDDNDVLKDEGSTPLTKKVSSPSADGSEMLLAAGGGGIASEKRQPSGLDKDVSETTSTTEQTTDEAASQSVTKTEIGDTKKATKNAGDSTSDSVSVTGRSEELLGGNSTAHPAPEGSDSSDEAVLSSAQSIVKVGSRAPRSDPFLADSARGDLCLVAKVESTKVDTISQHDAVADVGESVASPSSLLVAKSKINRSAAPPSEPVKDSARLVNAVKTNENVSKTKEATFRGVTSLETPQVGAIATAELRKVDESPLATDSPKEAKSDETSMASIGEASQAPKTKETETSTVQERNLSDLERPAEERDLMKAQTASPATSEARPIDPADTEVPAEEDVCLILGDADDDADEDDVPTICMAQTSNQGASSSLAIEPKITPSVSERAVDDDTPIVADIASAIEQETSAAGNVSGAGDPDDLWEAVFCADHDQNAALERSVWNEAENNSHRSSALVTSRENDTEAPRERSEAGEERSYGAPDPMSLRLPDKFQTNVESAVASILELQEPLDLDARPLSSLSSVVNESQEPLSCPDTQGPSAPDVDSAVQGLLDEAPSFEEVADADDEPVVGVVHEICIHDEGVVHLVTGDEESSVERGPSRGDSLDGPLTSSTLPVHFEHEGLPPVSEGIERLARTTDVMVATVEAEQQAATKVDDKKHHHGDAGDAVVDRLGQEALREATCRLSADVRSVTGDVVESVATTSRLVDDAADNNWRREQAPAEAESQPLQALPPSQPPVEENKLMSRPASLSDIDELKRVNLSEESSSDSDSDAGNGRSDHDDDDDDDEDDEDDAVRKRRREAAGVLASEHAPDVIAPTVNVNQATHVERLSKAEDANEPKNIDLPHEGSTPQSSRENYGLPATSTQIIEGPSHQNTSTTTTATTSTITKPPGQENVQACTASPKAVVMAVEDSSPVYDQGSSLCISPTRREAEEGDSTVSVPTGSDRADISTAGVSIEAGAIVATRSMAEQSETGETSEGLEAQSQIVDSKDEGQSLKQPSTAPPEECEMACDRNTEASSMREASRTPLSADECATNVFQGSESTSEKVRSVGSEESAIATHSQISSAGTSMNGSRFCSPCQPSDELTEGPQQNPHDDLEYPADSGIPQVPHEMPPPKDQDESAVSSQPGELSGPSSLQFCAPEVEDTREAVCYSEDAQSDNGKDPPQTGSADKLTPPECTTSGIRGSTTSSSVSEQSPSQDSPLCQQGPSIDASKSNPQADSEPDSSSDDEVEGAGPSEAAAKDNLSANPPELQPLPSVGTNETAQGSTASSSDDSRTVTASNNVAINDVPRHSGGVVTSSLVASLADRDDSCVEQSVDEGSIVKVKKFEVTSSSDQPHQGSDLVVSTASPVSVSCEPSAEAAAEMDPSMEPMDAMRDNAEPIKDTQTRHSDASSSDDKTSSNDRQSDPHRQQEDEEESLEALDNSTPATIRLHHAASSSSDAAVANDAYRIDVTLASSANHQIADAAEGDDAQSRNALAEVEACSSSDKHALISATEHTAGEAQEVGSSSGDARTEGGREPTDVQSSSEAGTEQQPLCGATSSDDVADENSAAESAFHGATPLSSAASTPGGYVGSSSPPPTSSVVTKNERSNTLISPDISDGSALEITGGASSSSDKMANAGDTNDSRESSSSSSGDDNGKARENGESREARAMAEDCPESEACVAPAGLCSVEPEEQRQDSCNEARSGANRNYGAERSPQADMADNEQSEADQQRPDASDGTKRISSSGELANSSSLGGPVADDSAFSAVTPSDATGGEDDAAKATGPSEESGRGRCQSTSEHRPPLPRTAAALDESSASNLAPEHGPNACSSSNTGVKTVELTPSSAASIDDDGNISSSNANNPSVPFRIETDNSIAGCSGGPEAKPGNGDSGHVGEPQQAEAGKADNKPDISSSQGTSQNLIRPDLSIDCDVKDTAGAAVAGTYSSNSENSCNNPEYAESENQDPPSDNSHEVANPAEFCDNICQQHRGSDEGLESQTTSSANIRQATNEASTASDMLLHEIATGPEVILADELHTNREYRSASQSATAQTLNEGASFVESNVTQRSERELHDAEGIPSVVSRSSGKSAASGRSIGQPQLLEECEEGKDHQDQRQCELEQHTEKSQEKQDPKNVKEEQPECAQPSGEPGQMPVDQASEVCERRACEVKSDHIPSREVDSRISIHVEDASNASIVTTGNYDNDSSQTSQPDAQGVTTEPSDEPICPQAITDSQKSAGSSTSDLADNGAQGQGREVSREASEQDVHDADGNADLAVCDADIEPNSARTVPLDTLPSEVLPEDNIRSDPTSGTLNDAKGQHDATSEAGPSEGSDGGRCQSTGEHRALLPRTAAALDEAYASNMAPELEPDACSSSNTSVKVVELTPSSATSINEDRNISSSNTNNQSVPSCIETDNSIAGYSGEPEAKSGSKDNTYSDGEHIDERQEPEAGNSDNKQDISSSQGTSQNIRLDLPIDVKDTAEATVAGTYDSSSKNSCTNPVHSEGEKREPPPDNSQELASQAEFYDNSCQQHKHCVSDEAPALQTTSSTTTHASLDRSREANKPSITSDEIATGPEVMLADGLHTVREHRSPTQSTTALVMSEAASFVGSDVPQRSENEPLDAEGITSVVSGSGEYSAGPGRSFGQPELVEECEAARKCDEKLQCEVKQYAEQKQELKNAKEKQAECTQPSRERDQLPVDQAGEVCERRACEVKSDTVPSREVDSRISIHAGDESNQSNPTIVATVHHGNDSDVPSQPDAQEVTTESFDLESICPRATTDRKGGAGSSASILADNSAQDQNRLISGDVSEQDLCDADGNADIAVCDVDIQAKSACTVPLDTPLSEVLPADNILSENTIDSENVSCHSNATNAIKDMKINSELQHGSYIREIADNSSSSQPSSRVLVDENVSPQTSSGLELLSHGDDPVANTSSLSGQLYRDHIGVAKDGQQPLCSEQSLQYSDNAKDDKDEVYASHASPRVGTTSLLESPLNSVVPTPLVPDRETHNLSECPGMVYSANDGQPECLAANSQGNSNEVFLSAAQPGCTATLEVSQETSSNLGRLVETESESNNPSPTNISGVRHHEEVCLDGVPRGEEEARNDGIEISASEINAEALPHTEGIPVLPIQNAHTAGPGDISSLSFGGVAASNNGQTSLAVHCQDEDGSGDNNTKIDCVTAAKEASLVGRISPKTSLNPVPRISAIHSDEAGSSNHLPRPTIEADDDPVYPMLDPQGSDDARDNAKGSPKPKANSSPVATSSALPESQSDSTLSADTTCVEKPSETNDPACSDFKKSRQSSLSEMSSQVDRNANDDNTNTSLPHAIADTVVSEIGSILSADGKSSLRAAHKGGNVTLDMVDAAVFNSRAETLSSGDVPLDEVPLTLLPPADDGNAKRQNLQTKDSARPETFGTTEGTSLESYTSKAFAPSNCTETQTADGIFPGEVSLASALSGNDKRESDQPNRQSARSRTSTATDDVLTQSELPKTFGLNNRTEASDIEGIIPAPLVPISPVDDRHAKNEEDHQSSRSEASSARGSSTQLDCQMTFSSDKRTEEPTADSVIPSLSTVLPMTNEHANEQIHRCAQSEASLVAKDRLRHCEPLIASGSHSAQFTPENVSAEEISLAPIAPATEEHEKEQDHQSPQPGPSAAAEDHVVQADLSEEFVSDDLTEVPTTEQVLSGSPLSKSRLPLNDKRVEALDQQISRSETSPVIEDDFTPSDSFKAQASASQTEVSMIEGIPPKETLLVQHRPAVDDPAKASGQQSVRPEVRPSVHGNSLQSDSGELFASDSHPEPLSVEGVLPALLIPVLPADDEHERKPENYRSESPQMPSASGNSLIQYEPSKTVTSNSHIELSPEKMPLSPALPAKEEHKSQQDQQSNMSSVTEGNLVHSGPSLDSHTGNTTSEGALSRGAPLGSVVSAENYYTRDQHQHSSRSEMLPATERNSAQSDLPSDNHSEVSTGGGAPVLPTNNDHSKEQDQQETRSEAPSKAECCLTNTDHSSDRHISVNICRKVVLAGTLSGDHAKAQDHSSRSETSRVAEGSLTQSDPAPDSDNEARAGRVALSETTPLNSVLPANGDQTKKESPNGVLPDILAVAAGSSAQSEPSLNIGVFIAGGALPKGSLLASVSSENDAYKKDQQDEQSEASPAVEFSLTNCNKPSVDICIGAPSGEGFFPQSTSLTSVLPVSEAKEQEQDNSQDSPVKSDQSLNSYTEDPTGEGALQEGTSLDSVSPANDDHANEQDQQDTRSETSPSVKCCLARPDDSSSNHTGAPITEEQSLTLVSPAENEHTGDQDHRNARSETLPAAECSSPRPDLSEVFTSDEQTKEPTPEGVFLEQMSLPADEEHTKTPHEQNQPSEMSPVSKDDVAKSDPSMVVASDSQTDVSIASDMQTKVPTAEDAFPRKASLSADEQNQLSKTSPDTKDDAAPTEPSVVLASDCQTNVSIASDKQTKVPTAEGVLPKNAPLSADEGHANTLAEQNQLLEMFPVTKDDAAPTDPSMVVASDSQTEASVVSDKQTKVPTVEGVCPKNAPLTADEDHTKKLDEQKPPSETSPDDAPTDPSIIHAADSQTNVSIVSDKQTNVSTAEEAPPKKASLSADEEQANTLGEQTQLLEMSPVTKDVAASTDPSVVLASDSQTEASIVSDKQTEVPTAEGVCLKNASLPADEEHTKKLDEQKPLSETSPDTKDDAAPTDPSIILASGSQTNVSIGLDKQTKVSTAMEAPPKKASLSADEEHANTLDEQNPLSEMSPATKDDVASTDPSVVLASDSQFEASIVSDKQTKVPTAESVCPKDASLPADGEHTKVLDEQNPLSATSPDTKDDAAPTDPSIILASEAEEAPPKKASLSADEEHANTLDEQNPLSEMSPVTKDDVALTDPSVVLASDSQAEAAIASDKQTKEPTAKVVSPKKASSSADEEHAKTSDEQNLLSEMSPLPKDDMAPSDPSVVLALDSQTEALIVSDKQTKVPTAEGVLPENTSLSADEEHAKTLYEQNPLPEMSPVTKDDVATTDSSMVLASDRQAEVSIAADKLTKVPTAEGVFPKKTSLSADEEHAETLDEQNPLSEVSPVTKDDAAPIGPSMVLASDGQAEASISSDKQTEVTIAEDVFPKNTSLSADEEHAESLDEQNSLSEMSPIAKSDVAPTESSMVLASDNQTEAPITKGVSPQAESLTPVLPTADDHAEELDQKCAPSKTSLSVQDNVPESETCKVVASRSHTEVSPASEVVSEKVPSTSSLSADYEPVKQHEHQQSAPSEASPTNVAQSDPLKVLAKYTGCSETPIPENVFSGETPLRLHASGKRRALDGTNLTELAEKTAENDSNNS